MEKEKMPKRRTRGKTKNHRGKAAVATTKTKIKIRRILIKKERGKERTQGRTTTQSLRREGRTVMERARRWLDPCQESRAWRERETSRSWTRKIIRSSPPSSVWGHSSYKFLKFTGEERLGLSRLPGPSRRS